MLDRSRCWRADCGQRVGCVPTCPVALPSPCRLRRSDRSRRCGRRRARAPRLSPCAPRPPCCLLRRRFRPPFLPPAIPIGPRRGWAMDLDASDWLMISLGAFAFGYPFVMAWYWMVGGVLFYVARERHMARPDRPPRIEQPPPISILVPCYNEGDNAEETLRTAAAVDYPEFEVIAINDGSRDNTAEVLDRLAAQIPRLRVVHLAANQGKATALNTGALLASHELLVCIDGDALLDPHALHWIAQRFRRGNVGGLGGKPRIRNRSSMLG